MDLCRLTDMGETRMMMKVIKCTRKWSLPGISDGEDCSGGSCDQNDG